MHPNEPDQRDNKSNSTYHDSGIWIDSHLLHRTLSLDNKGTQVPYMIPARPKCDGTGILQS